MRAPRRQGRPLAPPRRKYERRVVVYLRLDQARQLSGHAVGLHLSVSGLVSAALAGMGYIEP